MQQPDFIESKAGVPSGEIPPGNVPSGHVPRHPAESGQAIVLVALVMVALIGILGVALDGGGMYFLYRDAQNTADAAAVAASYARCTGGGYSSIRKAAVDTANDNGFIEGDRNTVINVENPPTDGTAAGDDHYTEVTITADKPSYFVHLIYNGPLRVTAKAISYCDPPFNPADLPPIWAGSTTCQDTVNWTGSSGYVEGGIFSNNEIKFGGGGQGNEIVGPTEAVNNIQTSASDNATFDPAPVTGVEIENGPLSHYRVNDFGPGGSVWERATIRQSITSHADDPDYSDGQHKWALNGSHRTLEGLYYVDGDVVLGNGLTYGINGVTIVATGSIKGSGGAMMKYYIDGLMLISGAQSSNCGDNVIDISGNHSLWFGVIWAPRGGINISGSEITIYGALIGDTIDISGSSLKLYADPDILPPRPPLVQMAE